MIYKFFESFIGRLTIFGFPFFGALAAFRLAWVAREYEDKRCYRGYLFLGFLHLASLIAFCVFSKNLLGSTYFLAAWMCAIHDGNVQKFLLDDM